jgi:hypothetical protein
MPVELVARMGLTLNLKTAKALGIEFSTGLLARADELIEQASMSGSGQPETDDRIRVAAASSQLADILGEQATPIPRRPDEQACQSLTLSWRKAPATRSSTLNARDASMRWRPL